MGLKLTTDPDTGILTVQAVDELEMVEAERFLGALYRSAAIPAMLWDLSRAGLAQSFDVQSVTSFILRCRPNLPGRTAVVAPDDVTYGLSRMGQVYLEDLPLEFQVFRNREDALSWLTACRR
jgi:hypothetical protein